MIQLISRVISAILLVFPFTACGGLDIAATASYEGSTLVVNGLRYERPVGIYECRMPPQGSICTPTSTLPRYLSGMISLELRATDEKRVTDRLSEYGLSIIERSMLNAIEDLPALSFLVVEVPTLFEEQWVEVLRKEPSVSGAWTNDIYYLP